MFHAGLAYQYTGNKKYADFVAQMLMEYAQKYPKWGSILSACRQYLVASSGRRSMRACGSFIPQWRTTVCMMPCLPSSVSS